MATNLRSIPFYLARKPGRHFLNHSLSYTSKIAALTDHYRQLLSTVGPRFTGKLLNGQTSILAEFEGKQTPYQIVMARNDRFCREGGIIVDLKQADSDRTLATLSLVLGALSSGAPTDLWIGGLQGCRGEDSKAVTITTIRDLWSLRPKDLMVTIAYRLGEVFAATSIKAISNDCHIVRRSDAKEHQRTADYDAFWFELGGAPVSDGFFLLPSERRTRCEINTPSAKRKAWRTRHALVADIEAQARNNIARQRFSLHTPAYISIIYSA